jgi:hypothetical protein
MVSLVMAWSPFQRANAGIIWVEQPGDYANPIPTTSATGPPCAKPLDSEPQSFEELKDLVGIQFRIKNIAVVPRPEWAYTLFGGE